MKLDNFVPFGRPQSGTVTIQLVIESDVSNNLIPEHQYQNRLESKQCTTRDVFYVRRDVDLMKTAKVNAYIMHIFGKIELLSIHAT